MLRHAVLRELPRLLVVALLASWSWMFTEITVPNERTRAYLAVALVDGRTLTIDGPVQRFGPVQDWATHDGHYYTDKAPGSSLLAALPYALWRRMHPGEDITIAALVQLLRRSVALPAGLLAFLLARALLRRRCPDPRVVDLVSFGWFLGTTAFHYSTALYGHQLVGAAFLGALWLFDLAEDSPSAARRRLALLAAGALTGFAELLEYQAAIGCVALALYVFIRHARRDLPGLLLFVLGVLPSVALFAWYHQRAFGGPLELSYHHLVSPEVQALHRSGVGGVALPTREGALGVTLSLHRGLLPTCPLVALLPVGLVALYRRGERALAVLLGGAFGLYVFMVAGAGAWYGGWSFGPRLLVPALALAVVPLGDAVRVCLPRPGALGIALGLASAGVLTNQAVHAFFPELPEDLPNPLLDALVPLWRAGLVSPNLAMLRGLSPDTRTVLPLAVMVLLVIVYMVVGSLKGVPWRGRLLAGSALLLVLGAAAAAPLKVGPTRTPEQTRDFVELVRFFRSREPPPAPPRPL
ncbi:MAG: hypothetical protein HY909_25675 [Deltaproteobacteria bacterium]|nr:hypothetical protein [Deltaproteobacteria bacterium]